MTLILYIMARKRREISSTGIYHVMLRGINKQDIFLDRNDFDSFLRAMRDEQNDCTYYAYCILHNHVHLLIREGSTSISQIMKAIEDRFVYIYNRKYERVGHLFQGRFLSEPVNDFQYFYTLLRYIHRNPVKSGEARKPSEYPYSSWREYLSVIKGTGVIKGSDPLMTRRLCNVNSVIRRFGGEELVSWVDEDVDDKCLDLDLIKAPLSDEKAWLILKRICCIESVEKFRTLPVPQQIELLIKSINSGVSIRQASRFASVSYKVIWRHYQDATKKVHHGDRQESRGLTP